MHDDHGRERPWVSVSRLFFGDKSAGGGRALVKDERHKRGKWGRYPTENPVTAPSSPILTLKGKNTPGPNWST
jgi:hypothetical protein